MPLSFFKVLPLLGVELKGFSTAHDPHDLATLTHHSGLPISDMAVLYGVTCSSQKPQHSPASFLYTPLEPDMLLLSTTPSPRLDVPYPSKCSSGITSSYEAPLLLPGQGSVPLCAARPPWSCPYCDTCWLYCHHHFNFLFFLLHGPPFQDNNLYVLLCESQNRAQCLAHGQT